MVCSASLRLSIADSISSSTILIDESLETPFVELGMKTYSGTAGTIIARVGVDNSSKDPQIHHPSKRQERSM